MFGFTMPRPVILTLTGRYLPGFKAGGPVRSIANVVESLGDAFEFRILCADRDLGDAEPYPGIVAGQWTPVGRASVRYLPPASQTLPGLARIIRETAHEALYLNSFFSPHFSILPLAARRLGLVPRRPLVLAPRGEFSPGALELKRAKKRAYLALGKAACLFGDVTWQASSAHEAADIGRVTGAAARDIHVATDLPAPLSLAPPQHETRPPGEPPRVVFLSRISPMKNLDYALRALTLVTTPVSFSVYGTPEDSGYLAMCERLAAALPAHVSVAWNGPVDPADVPRVMAAHDLFFLPTRGENYGHAIAEALAAGTPVLISDTTPWRDLSELGIGEDLPLSDPGAFARAIDRIAAQSPQEASQWRARAFAHAQQRQHDNTDIEANRQLFMAALRKG